MDEQYLTVDEVAERLRVHPETVRKWLRQGRLKGRRITAFRGWRVPASEVERVFAEGLNGLGKAA